MISLSGISYLSTCFPYVFCNPNPPPWTCYWLQQQHQSNLLIYMQRKQQKKIVTRITIGNESFAYKIHFSAFVSKMDATNLGSIGWFACINIVSTMSLEITQSSFSAAFMLLLMDTSSQEQNTNAQIKDTLWSAYIVADSGEFKIRNQWGKLFKK